MPKKATARLNPLTFDASTTLIARIETCRKTRRIASTSALIRQAIASFDFDGCEAARDPHRQISVRLPADQHQLLRRCSRRKKVSIGELVRLAVQALPPAGRR